MKATFGRGSAQDKVETKPKRKEKVVVWVKTAVNGDEYLSIKINDVEGKTLTLRAYKKNKIKDAMPDYVGYERLEE